MVIGHNNVQEYSKEERKAISYPWVSEVWLALNFLQNCH